MKRTERDIKEKKLEAARRSQAANDAIRRDWGEISPVTKVIPNKKKEAQTRVKYPKFDW